MLVRAIPDGFCIRVSVQAVPVGRLKIESVCLRHLRAICAGVIDLPCSIYYLLLPMEITKNCEVTALERCTQRYVLFRVMHKKKGGNILVQHNIWNTYGQLMQKGRKKPNV